MLKTIDLFAGAGGLSLGFEMAGHFKIIAAAEINNNAQETYKRNLAKNKENFKLIGNVIGYDFVALNRELGGIDVVIGGPPCQGFSNANRQKNHLISMNNNLIKEYFRAIKEIQPKAFVMENVNMLRSDVHRFYESEKDYKEINQLVKNGFDIPKREDILCISERLFENIDYLTIDDLDLARFSFSKKLFQMLKSLNKHIRNEERLSKYLKKNKRLILFEINKILESQNNPENVKDSSVIKRLSFIKNVLENGEVENIKEELSYIVDLNKMISTVIEIKNNRLLGEFQLSEKGTLIYRVNSYSVIDYINAILGGEYIQVGNTVNAEWFGVPQERRRYIVMGIKKDLYPNVEPKLPIKPEITKIITVKEAIMDLAEYEVGYEKEYDPVIYIKNGELSDYAKLMRSNSSTVKNHVTTKTREAAMNRFKQIKQGKNFHSLPYELKATYAEPDRTQNSIYLRLDLNKPSGTVVNVRKSMWIHPTLDRAVTVREAARLQSFPDDFEFVGTKDSQFQQVGNAVPPLLAKGIAEQMLKYILKK